MSVEKSQAVVYHGGGRRWFTLKAACRAEAKKTLKTRCECEHMDHGAMGSEWLICWYHEEERNVVLMRRLTGAYMRRFRAKDSK